MHTAATGNAVGTLQLSMLALNPKNPDAERVVSDPAAAHSMFCRVVNKPGSVLFRVAGARDDGAPVLIAQTREPVDWSPLGRQKLLLEERTETVDLAQFEEGATVSIDVIATAARNRSKNVWDGSVVTDPRSLARYAKGLGLDPEKIERLYRKGLVWTWTLKDGTIGTYDEGVLPKKQQIVGDVECKRWFMQEAFAVLDNKGQRTGDLSVEFLSCLMGGKRILPVDRHKDGGVTRLRPVLRHYSAIVTVTNAESFVGRITRGIGRLKLYGAGLIVANLV